MMKIGLVSDNHSYMSERVLELLQGCDEIWHAGDIGDNATTDQLKTIAPLIGVYGNIDGTEIRSEFPENQIFEREGLKIFMTHIGGYPGKYTARVKKLIQEHRPDVFICGHSHILKVMKDDRNNLLHMNPGAFGQYGFHTVRTFLRFDLAKGEITNLEVVELGKRGEIVGDERQ